MAVHMVGTLTIMLRRGELKQLVYVARTRLRKLDLAGRTQEDLGTNPELSSWYSDSGGPDLDVVLRTLDISSSDSAVDIGCGKGGALITMSKYPFRKLTGVEISSELVKIAEQNLSIMHIGHCRLITCDATQFTEYDEYTYIYFYNPFFHQTMRKAVDHIEASLMRCQRNVDVIYKKPVCHEVILANSVFVLDRTFSGGRTPINVYVHRAR